MSEQPIVPEKQDREIIRAVLTKDNKILLTINGNHIPSLCHIHKLLSVEIDKRIIDEQIRSATNSSKLIVPDRQHGILNYIRRGKHAG